MKTLINTGKSNDDIAKTHFDSEEKEKTRKSRKRSLEDEILVYATLKNGKERIKIFAYIDGKQNLLAKREEPVYALCDHDGKIYDAEVGGTIRQTLGNKVDRSRFKKFNIFAMCSHGRELFIGGESKGGGLITGDKLEETRKNQVLALCEHNAVLHDSGRYDSILQTYTGEEIITPVARAAVYSALCSHENKLYFAVNKSNNFNIKALLAEQFVQQVTKRDNWITSLCSCNGRLYDAGDYGIYDTMANKPIIVPKGTVVSALGVIKRKELVELDKKFENILNQLSNYRVSDYMDETKRYKG